MTSMTPQQLIVEFTNELAGVLTALAETPTLTQPSETLPGDGFVVTVVAVKGGRGALHVHIDRAGAAYLARQALGSSHDLPDAEVETALKEVCGQAVQAIVDSQRLEDVRLAARTVEAVSAAPSAQGIVLSQVVQAGSTQALLAMWGTLEIGAEDVVASKASAGSQPSNLQLDLVLDMELPLMVRFGRRELPLKNLSTLSPGAVIDLGRSPDEPVEVLVSNRVVARGEVVVVAGNYGVRILDVVTPVERISSVEVTE